MAKKKIYAVRKGNKTGLFYSWDECKKAVHGYSGAEYKGFLTKDEAEAFLNIGKITKGNMIITEMDVSEKMNETISDKIRSTTDKLVVYVDGSFDIHLQKYSFGCVILLEDGRIIERYGNGEEPELLAIRNVADCEESTYEEICCIYEKYAGEDGSYIPESKSTLRRLL